jgi:PST family polysaccharide transporter
LTSFFNALKWSVAGELASRALQPLVFVLLARLLTPDAYGVMAAAIMVISFTQVFWEAGMSKAIIQRQTEVEDSANVAFWINITLGAIIAAVLFFFADSISKILFQDERVANVLKVMTLQIFLGAIASVHTALLQKEMKFNRLFWVRMATVAVPGFFSIPLAWYGMSYWALVAGTLVGQAAQVIVLWRISTWRPSFSFNTLLAKQLGRFGAWVGLTGLLGWFYIWIDSLFVGTYLGTHELGLYRTGNQFIIMIYGFLFAPILPVLYSHFAGIQTDVEKLKIVMFKVIRIITLISIPLAFLIYAIDDSISTLVFGEKWIGIEFVLGIMALMHGYSWVVGANGEIYRAIGKPSYETVVTTISLGMYLVGYFISIKYGFESFVWTRFFLALAAMFLHISFGWIAVRLSVFPIIKIIVLATLVGSLALLLKIPVGMVTHNPFLQIGLISFGSGLIMFGILFLLERNGAVSDLMNVYKKRAL